MTKKKFKPNTMSNQAKPLLTKAGDKRLLLNGEPPLVDCRVVAEEYYQKHFVDTPQPTTPEDVLSDDEGITKSIEIYGEHHPSVNGAKLDGFATGWSCARQEMFTRMQPNTVSEQGITAFKILKQPLIKEGECYYCHGLGSAITGTQPYTIGECPQCKGTRKAPTPHKGEQGEQPDYNVLLSEYLDQDGEGKPLIYAEHINEFLAKYDQLPQPHKGEQGEQLNKLPLKTYNSESFGLTFMIDGDELEWTCYYYSHYSNKKDDRIPVIKGDSIDDCSEKMVSWMQENIPELLPDKQPTPSTGEQPDEDELLKFLQWYHLPTTDTANTTHKEDVDNYLLTKSKN